MRNTILKSVDHTTNHDVPTVPEQRNYVKDGSPKADQTTDKSAINDRQISNRSSGELAMRSSKGSTQKSDTEKRFNRSARERGKFFCRFRSCDTGAVLRDLRHTRQSVSALRRLADGVDA